MAGRGWNRRACSSNLVHRFALAETVGQEGPCEATRAAQARQHWCRELAPRSSDLVLPRPIPLLKFVDQVALGQGDPLRAVELAQVLEGLRAGLARVLEVPFPELLPPVGRLDFAALIIRGPAGSAINHQAADV